MTSMHFVVSLPSPSARDSPLSCFSKNLGNFDKFAEDFDIIGVKMSGTPFGRSCTTPTFTLSNSVSSPIISSYYEPFRQQSHEQGQGQVVARIPAHKMPTTPGYLDLTQGQCEGHFSLTSPSLHQTPPFTPTPTPVAMERRPATGSARVMSYSHENMVARSLRHAANMKYRNSASNSSGPKKRKRTGFEIPRHAKPRPFPSTSDSSSSSSDDQESQEEYDDGMDDIQFIEQVQKTGHIPVNPASQGIPPSLAADVAVGRKIKVGRRRRGVDQGCQAMSHHCNGCCTKLGEIVHALSSKLAEMNILAARWESREKMREAETSVPVPPPSPPRGVGIEFVNETVETIDVESEGMELDNNVGISIQNGGAHFPEDNWNQAGSARMDFYLSRPQFQNQPMKMSGSVPSTPKVSSMVAFPTYPTVVTPNPTAVFPINQNDVKNISNVSVLPVAAAPSSTSQLLSQLPIVSKPSVAPRFVLPANNPFTINGVEVFRGFSQKSQPAVSASKNVENGPPAVSKSASVVANKSDKKKQPPAPKKIQQGKKTPANAIVQPPVVPVAKKSHKKKVLEPQSGPSTQTQGATSSKKKKPPPVFMDDFEDLDKSDSFAFEDDPKDYAYNPKKPIASFAVGTRRSLRLAEKRSTVEF